MPVATVLAQAKINLFLRVLAREEGGHHQIETLFCRLALGDVIRVSAGGSGRTLDATGDAMPDEGLGPTERNLAWRAALLYSEAAGWPDGFAIEIEKRIPVGGGLGGGSADAGGVLRALNAMAPDPLSPSDLLRIAGTLGADVPFLTQAESPLALAWGRGERMLALAALPPRRCLLIVFPVGVSTTDAYRWLADEPDPPSPSLLYDDGEFRRWDGVTLFAYNAFERIVAPRLPAVRGALSRLRTADLRDAFDVVLLSGSGSTVFALPVLGDSRGQVALESGELVESSRVIGTFTSDRVEPVQIGD